MIWIVSTYSLKYHINFFTLSICTHIYLHIIQFHFSHGVNIYSNPSQEQFCNLSLYTIYILSVQ